MPTPELRTRRHRLFYNWVLVIAVVLLAAQRPAVGSEWLPGNQLPSSVQKILRKHKIPPGSIGIYVHDVAAPSPLLSHHASEPRNPASTMKLLTTFAALDSLGPAYTWTTGAYVVGNVRNGRLDGDLFLKGGGDPFLVTETFWKFLRVLREIGLQHISGDLVLDDGYFVIPPEDPGDFDGHPSRTYNATPNALLLNYRATRFIFYPDRDSNSVRVIVEPPSATLKIENRLKLTTSKCRGRKFRIGMHITHEELGGVVRLTGNYPVACGVHSMTRIVSAQIPYVFGVFKALWTEMGGTIEGGVRIGAVPEGARRLHVNRSRTLSEQIRGINKFSNNVMTRQLLLSLGAEHFGVPGTTEKGRAAVSDWLRRRGMKFPELVIDNGAGLSRDTRISAESLGRLLLAAYHSPYMPEFVSSLPISATDGSMIRRFNGEALAGRLHIKTGLLDDVRSMGGYVLTRSGRTFVVVTMHNHRGIHNTTGTLIQDALLRWLFEQ